VRRRLLPATAAVALAALCGRVQAQDELSWPLFFAPESTIVPADTARLRFWSRQHSFARNKANRFESVDSLVYHREDSAWEFRQRVWYDLARRWQSSNDSVDQGHLYSAQNQYLDLGGHYLRSSPWQWMSRWGLHWRPWFVLQQPSAFQAAVDLGPVFEFSPGGVPISVQGGLAATGWNDDIPDDIWETRYADFHGAPGVYGGIRIGDGRRLVPHVPLRMVLEGHARTVDGNGIGLARGTLLYREGIPTGDSLFVYLADSLLDGQESSLRDREGHTRFINSRWRIENLLRGAVGLKGAYRLHFQPSISYALRHYLITYPDEAILSDRKDVAHEAQVGLESDTLLFFRYRGALGIEYKDEDWLFRADPVEPSWAWVVENGEQKRVISNFDSLRVSNKDNKTGVISMLHRVGFPLPGNREMWYKYFISRSSRTYLNPSDVDTALNHGDLDRLLSRHRLGAVLFKEQRWSADLRGEFARDITNYVKRQRSQHNQTMRTYIIGARVGFHPSERFRIDEDLSARSSRTEYQYPHVHQGANECPPYTRKFESRLSGELALGRRLRLHASYRAVYSDIGRWYGREYFPAPDDTASTVARPERMDYYAVESKATETEIECWFSAMVRQGLTAELGAQFRDIYEQQFEGNGYDTNHGGIGYELEPYLRVAWDFRERLRVRFAAEWYVNTYGLGTYLEQQDWGAAFGNWDITLGVNLRL
jgi:hypothetical protein